MVRYGTVVYNLVAVRNTVERILSN